LVASYDLWPGNGTVYSGVEEQIKSKSKCVRKQINKEKSIRKLGRKMSKQTIYIASKSTNKSGHITAQSPYGANKFWKKLVHSIGQNKLTYTSHILPKIRTVSTDIQ